MKISSLYQIIEDSHQKKRSVMKTATTSYSEREIFQHKIGNQKVVAGNLKYFTKNEVTKNIYKKKISRKTFG